MGPAPVLQPSVAGVLRAILPWLPDSAFVPPSAPAVVTPALGGCWNRFHLLHSFLVVSFSSFSSDPDDAPDFNVSAVDEDKFDPGDYAISASAIRLWDDEKSKWLVVLPFSADDLVDIPFVSQTSVYFRLV